jgi:protein phosphatase
VSPGLIFLAEGGTDPGPRQTNDDTWLVGDHLLVVADGLGGKPAGKLAADLAARTLRDTIENSADPENELTRAVELAHNIILEHGRRDPRKSEMACTLDAVTVHGTDRLVGVHVGDSRAYFCQAGKPAQQMTADEAVEGQLLQSLGGVTNEIRPRVWSRHVQPGDRVVLATDGLWSALDDVTAAALITGTARLRPEDAVRTLVDVAVATGATDNITVIVADVAPLHADRAETPRR